MSGRFHLERGLCFERVTDPSGGGDRVLILLVAGPDPLDRVAPTTCLGSVPLSSWASVVSHLTAAGETAETHADALAALTWPVTTERQARAALLHVASRIDEESHGAIHGDPKGLGVAAMRWVAGWLRTYASAASWVGGRSPMLVDLISALRAPGGR